ncbi:class I SAM-dependent methyltransferase [Tessaracoccus sp.]|uniref:class I SAM-dependent methyltransferase n=1 Tax=Tessaracoccus sp. TaxID=1971211 RepID=UPI00263879F9|nr:class I SAM-dependent methyltransferase [Tessaracoccus sp.]
MAGQRISDAVGAAFLERMRRLNARHPWSHNDHFHSWIVANLPEPCRSVLDVGCGRGELLAALAPHVGRVVGADIDAEMRAHAASRCTGLPNVSITDRPWNEVDGQFDAVTMIAVLHHLPTEEALRDVRRLLSPGGRFLAVGLAVPASVVDHAWDMVSMATNPLIGMVKHPWPSRVTESSDPFPVKDPTLSLAELEEIVQKVLPGAVVRRHLGFRHTIWWTKPAA